MSNQNVRECCNYISKSKVTIKNNVIPMKLYYVMSLSEKP